MDTVNSDYENLSIFYLFHFSKSFFRNRLTIENIGYSKVSPNKIYFGNTSNSPRCCQTKDKSIDWQELGGRHRRHDVLMELQLNKVRFQHELYPENTREASCQVLHINEIEVRDRLATSPINKFLYQYSSESKPKQSHANMFAMKAIHLRPDPKLAAQQHLSLEFDDGFVEEMSVSSELRGGDWFENDSSTKRTDDETSMFESLWSSMTSSIQLAQECLQQDFNNSGNQQPLEGIELFAQTIDSSTG